MQLGNTVHFNSFKWVKEELRQLLTDIQRQLETYINSPDDVGKLDEIISLLRQVRGTLSLVEIYGAALLSEEMEMAARALKAGEVSSRENAYEVLLSAAIRLPDYLDSLSAGKKDVPLILLPLLNDLRACRNASLLSENVLFFPDVTVASGNYDQAAKGLTEQKEDPAKLGAQLRHQYQLGLLGWFKDEKSAEAFGKMHKVVGKLRAASAFDSSSRLWWVATGIVEALQKEGVESSVALKSLMGKVDRQIKRLADADEEEFAKTLPEELTKNLLYYVARAKPVTDTVKRLQKKFNLQQYLPDEEELANAARQLGGPNQELLNKVSEAIREDINQVKDAIEVFTHGRYSDPEPIKKLPPLYAKIADTLGMLGLGRCRENIMHEKSQLEAKLKSNGLPGEESLMATATALLAVETDLDAYVNRRLEAESDGDTAAAVPEQENAAVVASLVNEALKNIALVKDAFLAYVGHPDTETLMSVPVILKELSGAMFVAPLDEIAPVINGLNDYFIGILIPSGHQPGAAEQDTVADIVTNIECFLEAVAENRVDSDLYLAAGQEAVRKLSASPRPVAPQPVKSAPKAKEVERASKPEIREPEPARQKARLAPPPAKDYRELQVIGEDTDEEILEIFLEEALEELQKITSLFPAWKSNPGDSEAITTIRRSFHTLKGSGRLIGATMIGEFAWAIENMLNRLIDGTLHESPELLSIIDESIGVLPQLIEQIRSGNAQPVESMFELMGRAQQIGNKQTGVPAASGPEAADIGDDALDFGEELVLESASSDSDDELTITPEDLELAEADDFPRIDRGMIVEELGGEDIANEFVIEDDDDERPATSKSARASTGGYQKSRDLTGEYLTLTADPALLDIFSDEADAHLTEIARILEKARMGKMSSKNIEALIRALHTLHGSARTAKFQLIAEKAGLLEQHANNLAELGKSWQQEELDTLDATVAYIRNCIAHLKEHTSELIDDSGLEERVRACVERSEEDMKAARESRMDRTGYMEKADLDPELIGIFLEEAPDIIEAIERELQQWRSGGLKPDRFNEILRQLHTLKGSARMASLGDIGDLSHTLESLFIAIASGKLAISPAVANVLAEAVDRMVGMLDVLAQGRIPTVELEYLQKLEAIRLGKLDPSAADAAGTERQKTGGVAKTGGIQKTAGIQKTGGVQKTGEIQKTASQLAAKKLKTIRPVRAAGEPVEAVEQMAGGVQQQDQIRVRSDKLDMMVNYAGEVNIYHSRIGQYINNLTFNLGELEQTVNRLRRQLRDMEAETDAQIASRHEREAINPGEEFDPLEMDRYSHMQQLSKAMAESANDLDSLKDMLDDLVRSSEVALQQQSRVSTELQEELLQTRMVRFQGITSRLRRVIRQTAGQLGKKVELEISGEDNEIDRSVQERMIAPMEHMLRNAVFHGIEKPEGRAAAGKPETGMIRIDIGRDGSYIVMNVSDDGQGMNVERIRSKAIQLGLMAEGEQKSDQDIFQFIMHEGFSTADDVSQIAGRGVGMDVVDTEIKQLGGNLTINSEWGRGTIFSIRLPLTLAINQALLVQLEEDIYAIPLTAIEGVAVLNANEIRENMTGKRKYYEYAGESYDMQYLGLLLGASLAPLVTDEGRYPLLLLRGAGRRLGVHVDAMLGRREIVVKPVGPQITTIPGISGATILADGRVALIIDVAGLLRKDSTELTTSATVLRSTTFMKPVQAEPVVMVVDDSITIRKVTARILGRHNLKVVTAKDGLDAIQQLQEVTPDLFLMDIEMPRMDGFELATHVKSDSRLHGIPIIMITSRTGDKHRERARQIGVERYLGKPFQEQELMDEINDLLDRPQIA